jgi:uncharacterized membrane protein
VSAGHAHGAPPPDPSSRRARKVTAVVAAVLAALAVVLVIVLWPGEPAEPDVYQPFDVDLFDARITDAVPAACPGGPPAEDQPLAEVRCLTITMAIEEGPDAGGEATLNYVESPGAPHLEAGDEIVAGYAPAAEPPFQYYFADFQRTTPLTLLGLLFVVSVLLLGRFGGLRALLGAAASLVVVVLFLIPSLLEGTSPVLAALVASGVIAVLALYLTHGVNHRTNVAFLGTVASLGLTAALAAFFVAATHLTGLVEEDVTYLQLGDSSIDVTGLLLAGIVIGALGVLDDVTVTQVSAVWELHAADPTAPARRTYRAAIRIGRDHIASTVNTLVLAYTGAALPLLLLFQRGNQPLERVLNGEAIATEIVRALVGSIGLIASVPVTTALAVAVVGATRGGPEDDEEPAPEEPSPLPAMPVEPVPPAWEDFGPEERSF